MFGETGFILRNIVKDEFRASLDEVTLQGLKSIATDPCDAQELPYKMIQRFRN